MRALVEMKIAMEVMTLTRMAAKLPIATSADVEMKFKCDKRILRQSKVIEKMRTYLNALAVVSAYASKLTCCLTNNLAITHRYPTFGILKGDNY